MVREKFVRTSTLKDNTGKVSDIVKVSVSNVIKKNWICRKIRRFYQKSEKLDIKWHVVQAMKCTGWNNFSNLKSTWSSTKIGQFFLVSFFRCRLGIYILMKYHSVHQKFFSLHAVVEAMFFELNRSRFSVWSFGRVDMKMDFVVCYFNTLTLKGIVLTDAPRAALSIAGIGCGCFHNIWMGLKAMFECWREETPLCSSSEALPIFFVTSSFEAPCFSLR